MIALEATLENQVDVDDVKKGTWADAKKGTLADGKKDGSDIFH